jgi:uncharacterized protein (TIGR03435 family)
MWRTIGFAAAKVGGNKYDIVAKTQPTESSDTLPVMVQTMLADRFKLKVHKEAQPVTVYGLTVNKSKLKEADPNSRSTCVRRAADGALTLTCTNTTMAQFAVKIREVAGGYLEHPVVDLTGLKGGYDFMVAWAPRNRVLGTRPGEKRDHGHQPGSSRVRPSRGVDAIRSGLPAARSETGDAEASDAGDGDRSYGKEADRELVFIGYRPP